MCGLTFNAVALGLPGLGVKDDLQVHLLETRALYKSRHMTMKPEWFCNKLVSVAGYFKLF